VETTLLGNWFVRAEYRYADFGPSALTIARQDVLGNPISTNFDVALRTHTATFGVTYKFSGL
jgi:outer membrane immunogenic protein